jgi:hypothetical protein
MLLWTALAGLVPGALGQENAGPIQTGAGHRFACADYTQGKVFIVSAAGQVEWEYPAPNCNDLWVLPNGNLLFNTGRGVMEVTRQKQVVFEYRGSPVQQTIRQPDGASRVVETPSEIYACQRLANGNTFVGECNTGRLLEVAPDGKIAKELRLLPPGKDGGHAYIRNARRLADGHYLVAHYQEQVVREYDPAGAVVKEIPAAGGPHSAARLANGHTLIACGDLPGGSRIFEADAAGKTVWEIKGDELPGISLKFLAGFHRLPNGNTVLSNWLGHGQFGQAPHLIEVTPDKKVVWTFADHKTMRTISSIVVLDAPGEPVSPDIAH